MRTFAQKQNQPQKPVSSNLARSNTAAPGRDHPEQPILHLQRAIGNQAIQRILQTDAEELESGSIATASPRFAHDFSQIPVHPKSPARVQAKLTVSSPGDIYEQEADRVSEQVMRMPEPQLQRACACGGGCPKCQTEKPAQEHERLQTKRIGSSDLEQTAVPPIVNEVLRSPGQPLDVATRAFMEPRFGHDFSRVQVHTVVPKQIQTKLTVNQPGDRYEQEADRGADAVMRMPDPLKTNLEQLSGMGLSGVRVHYNSSEPAQLNALAYTQGQDIHMCPGQEKHLPHEGWHVVQQMQGRVKPTMQVKGMSINDDKELEREADVMGARALQTKGAEQPRTSVVQQSGVPKSGPIIQRWVNLGTERWKVPAMTERVMTVLTGTKDEWIGELNEMDDEDEYDETLWGFLEVSNDPSIVNRTRAPSHIGNAPYSNTITRAPNDREKLEFVRALYEMGGSLDLWRGSFWEGGPWTALAERDLATFINNNQGMLIADVSARGAISSAGVRAIAEQGGRRPTMAMIMNAGATAHKGVDLIVTANRQSGQARESAHAIAMETIRNAGRVIREALNAHDARVAFEQLVASVIFDTVWGRIPGGGTLTSIVKDLLKVGLKEGLKKAQEEGGPRAQAEKINDEFVATCNGLVHAGHITSADAQDAINGFEAVLR